VLLYAYGRIRAHDREGHRRAMIVAISLGVASRSDALQSP